MKVWSKIQLFTGGLYKFLSLGFLNIEHWKFIFISLSLFYYVVLFVIYKVAALILLLILDTSLKLLSHQLVYHDDLASYLFDNNYTEEAKVITVFTHWFLDSKCVISALVWIAYYNSNKDYFSSCYIWYIKNLTFE